MIVALIECSTFLLCTDCGCDHDCLPGNGESFVCGCRDGYSLQSDGKTCGEYKSHTPTGQSPVSGTA